MTFDIISLMGIWDMSPGSRLKATKGKHQLPLKVDGDTSFARFACSSESTGWPGYFDRIRS